MAWHTPRTWNVGELVTKTMLDEQIRDNLNALMTGTAAGDIEYFTGPNAKAPLAKPSVDSFLQMGSSGVPSWLAQTALNSLHAIGYVDFLASDQQESGGTWTDVTNATLNLTLTKTCTVLLLANAMTFISNSSWGVQIRGVIDGNANNSSVIPWSSELVNTNQSCFWAQINRPAGTRTCKIQFRVTSGGATAHIDRGNILAFAFG